MKNHELIEELEKHDPELLIIKADGLDKPEYKL